MKRQLMRLAAIVLVIMTAVAFAGCGGSTEPKTLEEYIDQNPDAREEVNSAIKMDSLSDIMDVEVNYKGNDVIIICALKTTYDEDIVQTVVKSYEENEAELKGSVDKAIKQIEDETGIEGVGIEVIIRNGDGSEVWKKHYTGE